jgi:hypothetical protein
MKMCNRNLRWRRNKSKAVSLGRIAVSPSSRSHSLMLGNLMLTAHCQGEGNVLYSAINNTFGGIHDKFSSFSVVTFFVDSQTKPAVLQLRVSLFNFSGKIFIRSALDWGPKKHFFTGARTRYQLLRLDARYETLCGIIKSTLVQ